jgi:hypothetical protein
VNKPVQALYRAHDADMQLTEYAGWLTDLAGRRTFNLLFREDEPNRGDIRQLRKPAMRATANEALRRPMWAHRDDAEPSVIRKYLDFALMHGFAHSPGPLLRLMLGGLCALLLYAVPLARWWIAKIRQLQSESIYE